MTFLLTHFLERCVHDFSMADILQLLEIISCIFDHKLEALGIIFAILSVDQIVDATCNSTTLVGWQNEHLGHLSAVSVVA